MRRPGLFVALALGILLAPLAAAAQPSTKVPRIGILANAPSALWEAFEHRLRELGHVPGQNLLLDYRWSEAKPERFPALAGDLVSQKVDLVVATSDAAARAVKQATIAIPVVFFVDGDPVAGGLVASLARPGGNLTGLTLSNFDLVPKRLELLREVVPKVSRVAVLWQRGHQFAEIALRETRGAAAALGLALQEHDVAAPEELDRAFAAIARQGTGGLVVVPSPLVFVHRARIAGLAAKARLPAIYGFRESVEAGGLMAYATNLREVWRRAAVYVDRILKGARPADLPVEQPTRFELVINLKTARQLGLTIPPNVLARADQVIE